jgi:group II intron reverse transcriptase/maturase
LGNLTIPPKVQRIQTTYSEKAKNAPSFRFYSLYDKICNRDVLEFAYRQAKANDGSPGVDGVSFGKIEEEGRATWLDELARELREKAYVPGAVRRVYIEKANGKMRPLGIPNIRDRVVQTAAVIILGSIFDQDLPEEQYSYREGRNACDAVKKVQCLINRDKHLEVVDTDLSGYFDTIPHPELMKSLARRISDGTTLHLIKMWLEAPVVEEDKKTGHRTISTHNRDKRVGTPQGSPISPLLSNIYMRRFILAWKVQGHEDHFGGKIVNYADDLVICCKRDANGAMEVMKRLMGNLKLTVNEEKTKVCIMPEGKFSFLGYEFREHFSYKKQKKYLGTAPSGKSVKELTVAIHTQTSKKFGWMKTSDMSENLNRRLRGWANYFSTGAVSKVYGRISRYVVGRYRRWLKGKFKWRTLRYKHLNDRQLYEQYNLLDINSLIPKYS